MWEHKSSSITSFASGFDLEIKVSRVLVEHQKEGWELVQVVVLTNVAEAIVFMKRVNIVSLAPKFTESAPMHIKEALANG